MADLPSLVSTRWIIVAVIIFQIKHLLADFFFQTSWMAQGKEKPHGWVPPLAIHAGLHGVLTAAIFAALAPSFIVLGLVDFGIHFGIDRTKGLLSREFDADTTKPTFWWLIGIDQTLHHLTHLGFAMVVAIAHTPR